MKLSELVELPEVLSITQEISVIRDADFDFFAQCIVESQTNIITFIDDIKYIETIKMNKSIAAVVCPLEMADEVPDRIGVLTTREPRYIFFKLYNLYMNARKIEYKPSLFGANFRCGMNSSISDKGVIVGDNVRIGDNVVIKENTIIGDNVTILSGCVIGEEGFEVKRNKDKSLMPVDHYGKTIIGKNTVIKSMVSIHKAVFEWDTTLVGENCVIDSMTHIAHAAKIHDRVLIGSNSSLCGNSLVMDNAYLGPNVCVCNRICVGQNSKVSIGSVVTKDVEEGHVVTGNFAVEHDKWIRFVKGLA